MLLDSQCKCLLSLFVLTSCPLWNNVGMFMLSFDAFVNFLEKITSSVLNSLKCFIVLLLCFQSVVLNIIHSNYPFIILDLPLKCSWVVTWGIVNKYVFPFSLLFLFSSWNFFKAKSHPPLHVQCHSKTHGKLCRNVQNFGFWVLEASSNLFGLWNNSLIESNTL